MIVSGSDPGNLSEGLALLHKYQILEKVFNKILSIKHCLSEGVHTLHPFPGSAAEFMSMMWMKNISWYNGDYKKIKIIVIAIKKINGDKDDGGIFLFCDILLNWDNWILAVLMTSSFLGDRYRLLSET